MSILLTFLTNYLDIIIIAFSAGGIGYFSMPILKSKIKKDGFQPVSDITEAVSEGSDEFKDVLKAIDEVVEDITVNDADTLNFIKDAIKTVKKFK